MFEKPSPEPLTGDLYFITCDYLAEAGNIHLNVLFRIPENGAMSDLDVEYCATAEGDEDIEFTVDDIAALKECIISSDIQDSP